MKRITQQAELDTLNKGKKTAVLFHASWCPFCRSYKPTFDEESASLTGREPIDALIDDESNPLWLKYNIEIVPTVIFFEDGKVVKRLDGKPGAGLRRGELSGAIAQLGPG